MVRIVTGDMNAGWKLEQGTYLSFDEGLNSGGNWCRFHQTCSPLRAQNEFTLSR